MQGQSARDRIEQLRKALTLIPRMSLLNALDEILDVLEVQDREIQQLKLLRENEEID